MELLRRAIRHQTQLSQLVITGRGIDNHLLGIQYIARETGIEIPELFKDSNFKLFNNFELSTSQIPTNSSSIYMCYGPVVQNGYGCSYNPQKVLTINAHLNESFEWVIKNESLQMSHLKWVIKNESYCQSPNTTRFRTKSYFAFHRSTTATRPRPNVSNSPCPRQWRQSARCAPISTFVDRLQLVRLFIVPIQIIPFPSECLVTAAKSKPRSIRDGFDYVRSNSQCDTLQRDIQNMRRQKFQRAKTQETIQD